MLCGERLHKKKPKSVSGDAADTELNYLLPLPIGEWCNHYSGVTKNIAFYAAQKFVFAVIVLTRKDIFVSTIVVTSHYYGVGENDSYILRTQARAVARLSVDETFKNNLEC